MQKLCRLRETQRHCAGGLQQYINGPEKTTFSESKIWHCKDTAGSDIMTRKPKTSHQKLRLNFVAAHRELPMVTTTPYIAQAY